MEGGRQIDHYPNHQKSRFGSRAFSQAPDFHFLNPYIPEPVLNPYLTKRGQRGSILRTVPLFGADLNFMQSG